MQETKQKEIREKFQKTFVNIEVRVPVINEYHTGKQAYDFIADFFFSEFSTLLAERDAQHEERMVLFRKAEIEDLKRVRAERDAEVRGLIKEIDFMDLFMKYKNNPIYTITDEIMWQIKDDIINKLDGK